MSVLLDELQEAENTYIVDRIHKALKEVQWELKALKQKLEVKETRTDDPVYTSYVKKVNNEIDSEISKIQNNIQLLYSQGKAPVFKRETPYMFKLHPVFKNGSDTKYDPDNPGTIIVLDLKEDQHTCPKCGEELSPASLIFHTYLNYYPMKEADADKINGTYLLDTKYCKSCNCHYCDLYELSPELDKRLGDDEQKSDLNLI